jgi:ABC-type phosphate/phosphonate transport system permease subunit
MKWLTNPTTTTTVLIIIFFVLWAATEVREMRTERKFQEQFQHFHDEGARFTADDGDVLRAQIRELEDQLMELQGEQRWEE